MKTLTGTAFLVAMSSMVAVITANNLSAPTGIIPRTTSDISTRPPLGTTTLSTQKPATSILLNTVQTTQIASSTTRARTSISSTTAPPSVLPVSKKDISYMVRVNVDLTILNRVFMDAFSDNSSQEYKAFEKEFKTEMMYFYNKISGFKDTDILTLRPGSVVVDHIVILLVGMTIPQDHEIIGMVKDALMYLKQNCSNVTSIYCIKVNDIKVVDGPTLNEPNVTDICNRVVPEGFKEFYTPLITSGGLVCVSVCNPNSPNYFSCNGGTCEIQKYIGPQCFCPKTDIYLYAKAGCTGRILLVAIYGGVGGAMAVLLISAVVLIFFLCRERRHRDEHIYEDVK